jgi:hypothetical protein
MVSLPARDVQFGVPRTISERGPDRRFSVAFEDDGDTGYLYGIEAEAEEQRIVDALQVYVVRQADNEQRTHELEFRWADGGSRVGLFIDGQCHAVFDFLARRAACRLGFPPSNGTFTESHDWDEGLAIGL